MSPTSYRFSSRPPRDEETVTTVLTSGTFWAGVVGLAGIVATLFAPRLQERRRASVELTRGLRLVIAELHQIQSAAGFVISMYPEPVNAMVVEHAMATPEWDAHHGTLAAYLPNDDWAVTVFAYDLAISMRLALLSDEPMDDDTVEMLEAVRSHARLARNQLADVGREIVTVDPQAADHGRDPRHGRSPSRAQPAVTSGSRPSRGPQDDALRLAVSGRLDRVADDRVSRVGARHPGAYLPGSSGANPGTRGDRT